MGHIGVDENSYSGRLPAPSRSEMDADVVADLEAAEAAQDANVVEPPTGLADGQLVQELSEEPASEEPAPQDEVAPVEDTPVIEEPPAEEPPAEEPPVEDPPVEELPAEEPPSP